MQKIKSLYDISLHITEEEYRKDKALSYSTLARYEREGFNNLDKLFDKIETPSLIFGSCVDSIITGGMEEFNDRFVVADFPTTPDSIILIVKALFNKYSEICNSLYLISDDNIINIAAEYNYQNNWKPETRAKVIKEKGSNYYSLLYVAKGKTIVDTNTYNDVIASVNALKESDATRWYFATDTPFDNIERLYQLKFKATINNIDYRCMMDLVIIDHDNKIIYPCDLKTSSHKEWDFEESFSTWKYMIQSILYAAILKENLNKDDYFKNFEIKNYRFIVVNRYSLTPLVWEFPFTFTDKSLIDTKGNIYRHPFIIGEELNYYLNNNSKVPKNINTKDLNVIKTLIPIENESNK